MTIETKRGLADHSGRQAFYFFQNEEIFIQLDELDRITHT